ncbi:SAV_2336 N-terminal domain-related protein [Streptomyces chartreusis]|uniref:SAV_2336 N-terminal domain-related protein n=1 Tax=Streptomyces chartreusis TaxID=1969 RepID=UPI0035DA9BB3
MAENRAARLLAALAHAGPGDLSDGAEGDIRDALDALLLAAARSGISRTGDISADLLPADEESLAEAPLHPEPGADDSCDDPPASESASDASPPGTASVWLKDDNSTHSVPGRPLSIGRAPALPNALDIGRALRPLRRFRPSRVHRRLDLGATVDHYTRTGVLVPQLAPAAEPWLEVVVVVDRGTSMAVWDETSRALTKMLRALSAFRSVRVWHLEHPPQAPPVLHNHHGRPLPLDPSDPRHIQPDHRLLLVVSDCAAPAWRRSDLWQTLHTWGRTAPVALINPLPKRLWQRSGLDLPRTTATASVPASPGRLLAYRRPRLFRDDAPGTQPWQALPVLQLDAHQVLAWTRATMRTDPSGCEAVLVPASGRVPSRNRGPQPSTVASGAPATDTHVPAAAEAFTDSLNSPAVRLAIAASSLDAFTLPVLDVIRERIVPEAALADTAEFLTAGLLTASRHENADIVYRFHPAAAEHLRGMLSRDQAWDTHFALTDHLAAHPQAPHGIVAALHSPNSQEMLPTGLRPVAQAAAATARLLGIEATGQAGLAVAPSHDEKDDVQQTPAPGVPDDLQEPERDAEAPGVLEDVRAAMYLYSHQRDMLDDLQTEREIRGRHRNLLVAPPGTGKTVMAAFDYRHLCEQHQRDLRLLFIADTEEALYQARQAYRDVLMNSDFGEPLHGARFRPQHWNHVFATVPAFSRVMDGLSPDHFDVIVIDEFRGGPWSMYLSVLKRFMPQELLGLSAAPERENGLSIHDAFFDSRIAVEMRLRDAMEDDLLSPVHYFGIADGTNFRQLEWKQGRYDPASLDALLTADRSRARIVINAVRDRVADVRAMRAVGFCASVAHADFMTQCFREAGFNAVTLTESTHPATRQETLASLRSGDLHAIFCVAAFGEGLRLPQVDTLLLLHPVSSGTQFVRQVGVALARTPGKAVVTVLDFIGAHRKEFRLDAQFRAMTNLSGRELLHHLEHGLPQLPAGPTIILDKMAKNLVTDSLRERMRGTDPAAAGDSRQMDDGRQPLEERPVAPVGELPTAPERDFDPSPRVVMVMGRRSPDTISEAGIILTPRLVLTCAHMSDEALLRIVRTDGKEIPCRTVWRGSGDLDAALVVAGENILESHDWERLLPSRLSWGRIPDGSASSVRVTGLGRIGGWTGLRGLARRVSMGLVIEGTKSLDRGTLTKMSGALVSCDGFFVGMVTGRHRQRPLLMAVSAALLLQDQGFRQTLATHMTTPYELEDVGGELAADSRRWPSALCLALEARAVSSRQNTDTPHLTPTSTQDIRHSLTESMRRASTDGVVRAVITDERTDLLMALNGPTAVRDMGRVLAELQSAAVTHHLLIGVGASIGEVTDTRLSLVGEAVSEASRLAHNTFYTEQSFQAARFPDSPVHFAVSDALHILIAEMFGPAWKDPFWPFGPPARDHQPGWVCAGSIEQLVTALATVSARRPTPSLANSYRIWLETKNEDRANAGEKASEFRRREADHRARAARERTAAGKTKNVNNQRSRLRNAQLFEDRADKAARDAQIWSAKAAQYGSEAARLGARLAQLTKAERDAGLAAAGEAATRTYASVEDGHVRTVRKELRRPRPEKLRVLLLGAASDSGLRVGREQQRILAAVRSATHRDLVEFVSRPAAADAFSDALHQFRPHIVHLSGGSAQDLIALEQGNEGFHDQPMLSPDVFARATAAADDKPLLVLLNRSFSAAQIIRLVDAVPFVISMSDSIGDVDATTYAARFYAAIAAGETVQAAHLLSRTAVEMSGLPDHYMPVLNCATDVNSRTTKLVTPPPE